MKAGIAPPSNGIWAMPTRPVWITIKKWVNSRPEKKSGPTRVVANYIVYFSTLKGSIEAADPCQNLGGEAGRLYARFIQAVLGIPTGGSALKNAQGQSIDYLALASKARTAVTVGQKTTGRRHLQTGCVYPGIRLDHRKTGATGRSSA